MATNDDLLAFITQQSELMKSLVERLTAQEGNEAKADNVAQRSMDLLSKSITEFVYDPSSGNVFDIWYDRFEDAFAVDGIKLDDAAKVRLLLRKLDSHSNTKYRNLILPKKPNENNFEETVKILKRMFGEADSLFSIRYNCLKLMKKHTEDYVSFGSFVNKEVERFKFNEMNINQFKCLIFICGLQASDKDIRIRLLSKLESDAAITLPKLLDECKRLVDLKKNSELISPKSSNPMVPEVRKISNKTKFKFNNRNNTNTNFNANTTSNLNKSKTSTSETQNSGKFKLPKRPCWLCGDMHWVKECSYSNHHCKDCNKQGHKEGFCSMSRPMQHSSTKNQSKKVSVKTNKLCTLFKTDFLSRRKFLWVEINECPIKLQVDTGSDISIISFDWYNKLGRPPASECFELANSATGHKLCLKLEFECKLGFNGTETSGICYVTTLPDLLLIGNDWLDLFGLFDVPLNTVCNQIQKIPESINHHKFIESLKQKFSTVFHTSLGTCTKTKATLRLKPNAQPIFRPKRPVPYAALPLVENELDRLVESGVLTKVSYSKWAAPIVVTKKPNGSIRMCADFATGLNDALETYHHPLPTPDSIFSTLNGGKYFSKIDLAEAFFQVLLDDVSKEYLTINTHRGLFQFNRLPFGIKTAPAIFQQIMDTMISGLQRTCSSADDIIVNGKTIEEHNFNLFALFERIKEWGFHIRFDKCKFLMTELIYLGFVVDAEGRHPVKSKIEAIVNMPEPHDVHTVKSFLGMINYYSQFVKEMRSLRAPLDKLLHKDAKFEWTNDCRNAFNRAKEILQSDLLLTHFDPTAEIKVAADASIDGIGAVILHRYPDGSEKAVEHVSRALTSAEKNYGQIEKEALSLVFACKKFHKMIWGRKFILQTDHQPLLAIFGSKKGIPVHSSSRLQRWSLSLMPYDFQIEHISTDKFGHADVLSRLIANRPTLEEPFVIASVQLMEAEVHRILIDAIHMLPVTVEMIRQATQEDTLLHSVIEYLHTNWPSKIDNEEMKIMFHRRDSLMEKDGCLLFNDRVLVPSSLQAKVLAHLHVAHPGIIRMKALARSYVYWPNIDKHITEFVQNCSRCASTAKAPTKAELSSWPKSLNVWSRVHIDYAGPFQGFNYLVVVDSFSKWPEIFVMSSTTSAATITKLRELIGRFGNMDILVSDNGPPFISHEFDAFCREQGVIHIPTPPYSPQCNGQAERFVDTFKRALNKAKGEESVPNVLQSFLQRYRMTPNPQLPHNSTPAEVMLGRKMKSTLDLMKPKGKIDLVRDCKMESDFNIKHGAKHRVFQPKQKVFVRDFRGRKTVWSPAVIIERRGSVLYTVLCDGLIWRRHANQIRVRYCEEDETSDPTLSLLLDTFECLDQQPIPQQSISHQSTSQDLDIVNGNIQSPILHETRETSSGSSQATSQVIEEHSRPQRIRRPPQRTNFSRVVNGKYVDY